VLPAHLLQCVIAPYCYYFLFIPQVVWTPGVEN